MGSARLLRRRFDGPGFSACELHLSPMRARGDTAILTPFTCRRCTMGVPAHLDVRPRFLPRRSALLISSAARSQLGWLLGGIVLAFLIPFALADRAGLPRDVYYALYTVAVFVFVSVWASRTQRPLRAFLTRGWRLMLPLTAVAAALLVLIVLRQSGSSHPHGWTFAGAILWRGVVYGVADGALLSAFPILAVFALFRSRPLRERTRRSVAAIGALALAVSLLFTAVYHVGYPDFRSSKVKSPLIGDVVWSAPTLLTLNPLGAPLAHVALHVTAVAHSYDTDLFLPPHGSG
jgi:hypothetical protein